MGKINFDEEIDKRVKELNILYGKRKLMNLTFDDLKVYTREGVKRKKDKVTYFTHPFVVVHVPRYYRGAKENEVKKDYYSMGHRIVVSFAKMSPKECDVKKKEVLDKVMGKVREHAKEFYGLDKIPNPS